MLSHELSVALRINVQFPKVLSIVIIDISEWSILIQWIRVVIVMWQSDLVNTNESVLLVSDKPYYMNKRKVQKEEEIGGLRNCASVAFIVVKILPTQPFPYCRLSADSWVLYENMNIWLKIVEVEESA